jgi:hypothetical protein
LYNRNFVIEPCDLNDDFWPQIAAYVEFASVSFGDFAAYHLLDHRGIKALALGRWCG